MNIVAIVFQVLLGIGFLMAGGMKVAGTKQSLQQRDHLRIAPWFWTTTGALEVLGALGVLVGLAWHPLAAAAGLGLALVMLGAMYTHVSRREPLPSNIPSLVLLAFAVTVALVRWPDLVHFV